MSQSRVADQVRDEDAVIDPKYVMAKQRLAAWAGKEYLRNQNVPMGMTDDALAPQHAIWLLEYVMELEKKVSDLEAELDAMVYEDD